MPNGVEQNPCAIDLPFSPLNHVNPILARDIPDHRTTSSTARVRLVASRRRKIVQPQTGEISIFQDSKRPVEAQRTSIQGGRTTIQATELGPTIPNRHYYEGDSINRASSSRPESPSIAASYRAAGRKSRLSGIGQCTNAQTIYIPSEDIGVTVTHPGRRTSRNALAILTGSEKSQRQGAAHFISDYGVTQNRKTSPKKPSRGVLEPAPEITQEFQAGFDRPGAGPGKENLRSEHHMRFDTCKAGDGYPRISLNLPVHQGYEPKLARRTDVNQDLHCANPPPKRHIFKARDNPRGWCNADRSVLTPRHGVDPQRSNGKFSEPHLLSKYRFLQLTESLDSTQLYEVNRLENQESAIAQFINRLTDVVDGNWKARCDRLTCDEVRQRYLGFYQLPSTIKLCQNLQASLLYGSLRSPKCSQEPFRIRKDVGFRKRFTRLWTDTYDLQMLSAALEVVIGRQINDGEVPAIAHQSVQSRRKLKNRLTEFIYLCLLGSESEVFPLSQTSSGKAAIRPFEPRWHCLLLRSLMIVYLLDKSADPAFSVNGLFQPVSKFRSSQAVLAELGALLLPAIGNINRSLAHLEYQVDYEQHALTDYDYRIVNIATDLRDGVRLAHFVEMFLLSAQRLTPQESSGSALPGPKHQVFSPTCDRPLSKQLKVPCIGRAQKIYNVQITLDALQSFSGLAAVRDEIKAEDIVDGHREKSIFLLWALVGKWPLVYD